MPATWDPATVTAVTLSGGNLVATNTGTTATDQGARVATALGQATGKYYFESTFTTMIGTVGQGADYGIGVGTTASTYVGMGFTGAVTGCMVYKSGGVYLNGVAQGSFLMGSRANGDVIGVAVDLDNRRHWFRVAPSGLWNANGSANPATNTGGFALPAGTMVPFVTFGGTGGVANNVLTANFGAAAFSGAVPSGFIAGFPTAGGGAVAQARVVIMA